MNINNYLWENINDPIQIKKPPVGGENAEGGNRTHIPEGTRF